MLRSLLLDINPLTLAEFDGLGLEPSSHGDTGVVAADSPWLVSPAGRSWQAQAALSMRPAAPGDGVGWACPSGWTQ